MFGSQWPGLTSYYLRPGRPLSGMGTRPQGGACGNLYPPVDDIESGHRRGTGAVARAVGERLRHQSRDHRLCRELLLLQRDLENLEGAGDRYRGRKGSITWKKDSVTCRLELGCRRRAWRLIRGRGVAWRAGYRAGSVGEQRAGPRTCVVVLGLTAPVAVDQIEVCWPALAGPSSSGKRSAYVGTSTARRQGNSKRVGQRWLSCTGRVRRE